MSMRVLRRIGAQVCVSVCVFVCVLEHAAGGALVPVLEATCAPAPVLAIAARGPDFLLQRSL